MAELDPWYLENLVCPVDKGTLRHEGNFLISPSGNRYPVVDGVPVMLLRGIHQTIGVARTSIETASDIASGQAEHKRPYVETLGISRPEKEMVQRLYDSGAAYDAVATAIVGATSGTAYGKLIGAAQPQYPIPYFRFPEVIPGRLLDIGCNWGRWTIAAARQGFDPVGIDPQLGAILAAQRIAIKLGVRAHFVVGDGRYLPFKDGHFDQAWSYSVLQHFSDDDMASVLASLSRTCRRGATVRIQFANILGPRSFYMVERRRFRRPAGFEVRYRYPRKLKRAFADVFGNAEITADCFLGLGLQWSDFECVSNAGKAALLISEPLRRASQVISPLAWAADSVFLTSVKGQSEDLPIAQSMSL